MPFSSIDKVHFSVTSPSVVIPGNSFVLNVCAHLEKLRAEKAAFEENGRWDT